MADGELGNELFEEILTVLRKEFEIIKELPCRDGRMMFPNRRTFFFRNALMEYTMKSTFIIMPMDNGSANYEMKKGWALLIQRIAFAPEFRRRGYGLRFFQWLRENSPTEFIFIESVITDEMANFLIKNQNALHAFSRHRFDDTPFDGKTDWILLKN